ncbi:MAG: hypothetical protein Solivirus1_40 [Solivirus sp.]|uniref:Uncharacterized protein n=1 Tax=Solivirus sp. TaxID=2487772 RepID=A0A3G5AJA6_9VIRU|nr:MAG: hypothetical protein Solivirus1_40 [Solivirus sp.]
MSLDEIFKDVYLANRLMVDMDQDQIDILSRNSDYKEAFSPALQRQLYITRLRRLGMNEEELNKLLGLHDHENVSWSKIYNISEIMLSRDRENENLLIKKILSNDDLIGLRIIEVFYNLILDTSTFNDSSDISYEYIDRIAQNNSRKAFLHLLRTSRIANMSTLSRINESIVSFWNDIDFLKQYLAIINDVYSTRFPNFYLAEIRDTLIGGAMVNGADKIIKYYADTGHIFSGEDMAYIARTPELKYLVPYLLEHGSNPVDEFFYLIEFGQEYVP